MYSLLSSKKKDWRFALFGCIMAASFLFSGFFQVADAAIGDTITAFWNLNETSATRADSAGSTTLSNTGSVGSSAGKIDNAASFSGSNYLSASDTAALSTGNIDFTVSGWVYLTSKSSYQTIISKYESNGNNREYILFYHQGQDKFYFGVSNDGTALTGLTASTFGSPSLNTWYFVTVWHDSVNDTLNIQVNNGAVDSLSYSSGVFDSTASFQIGNQQNPAQPSNARIDAVGFWKRTLTSGEKTALYNSGNGLEYPFTVPGSPSDLTSVAGSTQASLSWTAPSSNGGSAITDYIVQYKLSSEPTTWTTFSDGTSTTPSATVTGLTNGLSYDFRVSAISYFGTSLGSATVTRAPSASFITITNPSHYQIFQRNGSNQASIVISGTYTGSPTAIEASWNGGSYTTISASPTGGVYSGTLSNQTAGQGTLIVRFANSPTVSVSKNYVGIGDIFIIAGQSNGSGHAYHAQSYSNPTLKASMFGNDDAWKELIDPTDDGTNQVDSVSYDVREIGGSVWPLVATEFMADQEVPIAFVPAAKGGSSISQWQRNLSVSTLYGSMYRRIIAAGGAKAVVFWQGESDAGGGVSESSYKSQLVAFADSVDADFGLKTIVAQIGDYPTTESNLNNIRLAQKSAWNDGGNVLPGPVLYDINLSNDSGDGLHFSSDADIQVAANRWWAAIQENLYDGSDGRGPILSAAQYNATRNKLFLTFTDTNTPLLPASSFGGFTVKGNGSSVAITSSARTSANVVELTLVSAATLPITVSLGSGSAGVGVSVPTDSSSYALPAEIFIDTSATPVTTPGTPTSLSATPGDAQVSLSWTAPASNGGSAITDYIVQYKLSSEPTTWTTFSDGTSTTPSATVTGLINALTYDFRVAAVNAIGTGSVSGTASATPVEGLNSISSVSSGTPTSSSVTITWTTAINASSQVSYGYTSSYGSTTTLADTSPRVTSHSVTISSLLACTTYHYQVTSVTAGSASASSADNTFITSGCTGSAVVTDSETSVITTSGATLALNDVTLVVPNGYAGATHTFQAQELDAEDFFAVANTPSGVLAADTPVYHLVAITSSNTLTTTFLAPLSVTLSYDDNEVTALTESSLAIYRYDSGTWTRLDGCSVNTSANTVTCTTTHFSDFALFGTSLPQETIRRSVRGYMPYIVALLNQSSCTPGDRFNTATGTPCPSAVTTAPPAPVTFTRNLFHGMTGSDIKALQIYLNTHGYPIAPSGIGSRGRETTYFGLATKAALKKFQLANKIPSTGNVGPMTRKVIESH